MAQATPIRVLVVDDSRWMRGMLRAALERDPAVRVVGEAGDGRQAIEMAMALRPQVVTMDLDMPVLDGLSAIGEIMSTCAVPVLVVSTTTDSQSACEAISRGALDVMGTSEVLRGTVLADKVKLLAGVPVIKHVRRIASPLVASPIPIAQPAGAHRGLVFAIASSTGGPQALAELLAKLPADFPHPIVVAQHIVDGFAAGLAEWLDSKCALAVKLAVDGDQMAPGVVSISPSESNMTVTGGGRMVLTAKTGSQVYHPSCDQLLISAADEFGNKAIGIILSGMGRDGAAGIERIAEAGGATLAQDEASSIIFGMNRVAIETGKVGKVLPLRQLAEEMCKLAATAAHAIA